VEGLAGSVPLFSEMDFRWGERDMRKNKDMEKEKNILWGHAHDLSATKLCTIIASTGTKVALSPTGVAMLAPKLLCELSGIKIAPSVI
jgi:hypothetical protein